jgi:hypothetical protein
MVLSSLPTVSGVRKAGTPETNAFRQEPFPLNPCGFTLRPDPAAGADDSVPGKAGRAFPHGGRNLPGASPHNSGYFPI